MGANGHVPPIDREGVVLIAQLRAEILKQRSTWTALELFSAMLALALLAVLLHAFGLPSDDLGRRSNQLMVFGRGELLGVLFAAPLGALSITGEFHHGTIRPTFLVMPRRERGGGEGVGEHAARGRIRPFRMRNRSGGWHGSAANAGDRRPDRRW